MISDHGTATSRRRATPLGAVAMAIAVTAAPLVVATQAIAAAATPTIRSANLHAFPAVLENAAARTLYVLSTEKGAKLHCTGPCLSTWLPLLVSTSTKKVAVASTVKGKIGFVSRSKTQKQVTVNTYPVYTYKGDAGPNQTHGEAFAADGGTWFLVHAAATSTAATTFVPLAKAASSGAYTNVLQGSAGLTFYVLSTEKGGQLNCTGMCLVHWPPLLVPTATTAIALGAGVKGTIAFVTRSSTEKQVTFNSYPVYNYTGDSGPAQVNGENYKADGGTWLMVAAGATSAAATPVPPKP